MSRRRASKNSATYTIRMPRATLTKLRALENRTQVTLANMVLAVLVGLVRYEEQHGELRVPFQIVPRRELEAMSAAAGQPPAERPAAEPQQTLNFSEN